MRSNNCQVLTLVARVIGPERARKLVSERLDYGFDAASATKVAIITNYIGRT